jgi:hypothetical protein
LNQPIIIHAFKIVPSKFNENGKRLDMQITYNNEKRLLWTSAGGLIDIIQQIAESDFPLETIIKELEDKSLDFT